MEYEIEVTIRRYKASNFGVLEHPDEVEVYHGRTIFDPEFSNVLDLLDGFKNEAFDRVDQDSQQLTKAYAYDEEDLIDDYAKANYRRDKFGE